MKSLSVLLISLLLTTHLFAAGSDSSSSSSGDSSTESLYKDAVKLIKRAGKLEKKEKTDKEAAKSVNTKSSRNKPLENESSNYFKESDVQDMSAEEYEKNSDAIMEAIRANKFIYDISGNAR